MLLPADVAELSGGKNNGSNSLDLLEDVMLEEIDAAANLVNNTSIGKRDSVKKKSSLLKASESVLDKENSSLIVDIVAGGESIEKEKPGDEIDFENLIQKYETILTVDETKKEKKAKAEDSWGDLDGSNQKHRKSNKKKPIDLIELE
jgi:hypothetical protein